jgi:hypothetical protein
MADSTTSSDIPQSVEMVAGYIDGAYAWSILDWGIHVGHRLVQIATSAATDGGQVLDVETGDATPAQAVDWALMRARAGVQPTIYVQRSRWDEVKAAFAARGILDPLYWIAEWDNQPGVMPGAVAHQYANPTLSGGHYDLSAVLDYWPSVDPPPIQPGPKPAPADAVAAEGQFWQWGADLVTHVLPDANNGVAAAARLLGNL